MASITQSIPNFALGISQQADESKLPGQVKDLKNAVPDITDSLYKRPGTKFIKTLTNYGTGKWFNYYRDADEGSYVGLVQRNGTVRVWRVNDGAEMAVTTSGNPSTYLAHTTDSNIGTCTINDTTFICNSDVNNSSTEVKMVNATTPDVAPSKPDANSVYVELKQVAPRRQYALNIYDNDVTTTEFSATSVEVVSGFTNNVDSNEDCRHTGTKTHVDSSTGIAVRVTVIGQPFVSGYDNSPPNAQYNAQYTLRVDLLHGGTYSSSKLNQNAFTVNVEGINHTIKVTSETQGDYRVNLQSIRPVPCDIEQDTSLNVASVLNSIQEEITQVGFTKKVIGNGLYITRPSGSFNVEALEGDLFNIVKDEVNDVASLPTCCKHGYIVKVVNSADLTEDDYYLKFVGENNRDGEGHWEECPAPGVTLHIDANTMPYVLQRTGPFTMTLAPYAWEARQVGDNITNKKPSFLDNRISQVLFHRNRLVMLSGSNIVLSQPDDLGNFWNKTALTFSGIDRIDISSSSSSPNQLVHGIEMNTGLVLFSASNQFLFATDSDLLNPQTAKVYSLSTYNFNIATQPFSLGTSLGFVETVGSRSRFHEMTNIRTEGEPVVLEPSKVVPRLLPQDVDLVANSRENTYIFFGKKNTKDVFGFKYFNSSDQRLQGAWFRWEFPQNIMHHFVDRNTYYTVDSNGVLSALILQDSTARPTITNDEDEEFDVHLDNHQTISSLTYNSSTDKTTFNLPSVYTSGKAAAIVVQQNDDRGRYQIIDGSPGSTGSLNGDWTGSSIVVGDQFEMSVELPTIFPTSTKGKMTVADTKASLILQRVKFNFGQVGQFTTTLERVGKADFVDVHQSSIMDGYEANRAPFLEDSSRTIPVYERNTNVNITLSSTHPSPATLQSMSWEGDYTTNYYKRI